MNKRVKHITASLGATGILAATAVAIGTGAAYASTISTGYVEVCAQGNYSAYAEFPYRGNVGTFVIPKGQCWYYYMGGDTWEPIEVFGIYNTSGQSFELPTVWYNGSVSGVGIGAEGTTVNPYEYTW